MILYQRIFFTYLLILTFPAKSMADRNKGSKGDSSNDPKASTDSSTTLEDDDPKGMLFFVTIPIISYYIFSIFTCSILKTYIFFEHNKQLFQNCLLNLLHHQNR